MTEHAAAVQHPVLASHQIGVLIIDDDALVRGGSAQDLEVAGLIAFEAKGAGEAIALLESRADIRVVITDVDLQEGDFDGFQLASQISERWPDLGLLIVSGCRTPRPADLPVGARFLSKPCRSHDLICQIFAHVEAQSDTH